MTWDDFIYAFLLLIALFGAIISNRFNSSQKKYFMSISGLFIVFFICGSSIWHSLLVTFLSILIICSAIDGFHVIVFILCFGYLVFFRTCHLIGFDKPPSYSNAIQLVLTLKLVGAGFEIKDSLEREKKLKVLSKTDGVDKVDIDNLKLEVKYYNVKADFIDLFMYSYCFIGLFTGPYFKYRLYLDCIHFKSDFYFNRFDEFFKQLQNAFFIGLVYLGASHFYYIEYAKTDEFFQRSFVYRLFFMSIMFFVFRLRMYFAWLMSHCVCMCAGMGAYPLSSAPEPGHGPTNLKALESSEGNNSVTISYEATRNLSIAGCEWAPTVREGMRSWNMSVQYWLVTFVYRRFPSKKLRTLATMLVSAFWHGVHPGYYLSFMTIPLSLIAEAVLETILRVTTVKTDNQNWLPRNLLSKTYFIRWFFKMRVFDYCCMGFLLLGFDSTLRYWWSIGLSMHLIMIALISFGFYTGVGNKQTSR